jgi:hypothetical protein
VIRDLGFLASVGILCFRSDMTVKNHRHIEKNQSQYSWRKFQEIKFKFKVELKRTKLDRK